MATVRGQGVGPNHHQVNRDGGGGAKEAPRAGWRVEDWGVLRIGPSWSSAVWSAPGPGAGDLRDGRNEPTSVPGAGPTPGLHLPVRLGRSLSPGAGGRSPSGGGGRPGPLSSGFPRPRPGAAATAGSGSGRGGPVSDSNRGGAGPSSSRPGRGGGARRTGPPRTERVSRGPRVRGGGAAGGAGHRAGFLPGAYLPGLQRKLLRQGPSGGENVLGTVAAGFRESGPVRGSLGFRIARGRRGSKERQQKGETSQCGAPWQNFGMPRRTGDGEALQDVEINQNLFGGGGVSEKGKEEIDQIQARGPAVWWGNRPLNREARGDAAF